MACAPNESSEAHLGPLCSGADCDAACRCAQEPAWVAPLASDPHAQDELAHAVLQFLYPFGARPAPNGGGAGTTTAKSLNPWAGLGGVNPETEADPTHRSGQGSSSPSPKSILHPTDGSCPATLTTWTGSTRRIERAPNRAHVSATVEAIGDWTKPPRRA